MSETQEPADQPTGAESPAATEPRRPRRRKLKITLAVFLALGLFVGFLPALLSTGWTRDIIHGWLADNVDRRVEFADLDVSWTGGIVLRDLVVYAPDGGGEPQFEAPYIHLDAPLLPLLTRRLEVDKFVLRDAVVRISMDDSGRLSTEGAVKRKKARRKKGRRQEGRKKRGDGEQDEEPSELVLPEIHVPVEIRNLTLVFSRPDGREVRQEGISLVARIWTREGPTDFDLHVPAGPDSALDFRGSVRLFDAEGMFLPPDSRELEAELVLQRLDAAGHAELLQMFFDLPVQGVLDGWVKLRSKGVKAAGEIEVRLLDVAIGDAVGERGTSGNEDLVVTGRFEATRESLTVQELRARAEGLDVSLDLTGNWEALEGSGSIDADLAQLAATLRKMGVEFAGEISGRLGGSMEFPGGSARGVGELKLTRLRLEGLMEDRPPVTIDSATIDITVLPSPEEFRLESLIVRLPDLKAVAEGVRRKDGGIELDVKAEADLGALLARVRDLGMVPGDFSLNGKLDATARIVHDPETEGVTVNTWIELTDDDVQIKVVGERRADGRLDFSANGDGDLGKLLARAIEAGSVPDTAAAVRGRFSFSATGKGTPDALDIALKTFDIDGDLHVHAEGSLTPEGTIGAQLAADGRLDDLVALLARLGVVERANPVAGNLEARITVAGTRDEPLIEVEKLLVQSGAFTLEGSAARDVDGNIATRLEGKGELADAMRLLQAFGAATDAEASGPIELTADVKLADDIVTGSISFTGDLTYRKTGEDEPVHEPELGIFITDARFHLKDRRLEPLAVRIEAQDANLEGIVSFRDEPATDPEQEDARFVTLKDTTFRLGRQFTLNHPEWVGDVVFDEFSGAIDFDGDIAGGLERASTWNGNIAASVKNVKAPYAMIETADLKAVIGEGKLLIDPLTAKVNNGDVNAVATIGLVGKRPEHDLDLDARDVDIDGELAPFIAQVSPLFAIGEEGNTGGKLSVQAKLTASGLTSKRLKRTVNGSGVLELNGAYVESTNWLGKAIDMLGGGNRLELPTAKIPFVVKDGKIKTDDIPILSKVADLRMGGEVTLDGDLDYLLRLKPTRASPSFEKFARLLDADGYLPLHLGGNVSDPDLDPPKLTDIVSSALKGKTDDLKGLWDRLRGKKDKDKDTDTDAEPEPDDDEEEKKRKRRKKRRKKKKKKKPDQEDEPPPPPPPDDE